MSRKVFVPRSIRGGRARHAYRCGWAGRCSAPALDLNDRRQKAAWFVGDWHRDGDVTRTLRDAFAALDVMDFCTRQVFSRPEVKRAFADFQRQRDASLRQPVQIMVSGHGAHPR